MATSRKRAPRRRGYDSPLRAEQAATTRRRILDGVLAAAASGGDLEIPALAKAIHVSVPTIYRHFPSRADLLRATVEHVEAAVGPTPHDPEDLVAVVRAFFERRAAIERRLGPIADHPIAWELRRTVTVPLRRAWAEQMLRKHVGPLSPERRRVLVDLLVVLVSSTTAAAFARYVDCTPAQTAQRVQWAIDAFFEHARRQQRSRR